MNYEVLRVVELAGQRLVTETFGRGSIEMQIDLIGSGFIEIARVTLPFKIKICSSASQCLTNAGRRIKPALYCNFQLFYLSKQSSD